MKRGEKDVSPFLSIGHQTLEPFKGHQTLEPFKGHQIMEPFKDHQTLEPSKNHQTLELSKDHQTLEPSISQPSWGLPSPPSFSFSLKGKFKSFGSLFFPNITFDLNLEKTCSHNFPWEEKND